jgi:hypothetical protein
MCCVPPRALTFPATPTAGLLQAFNGPKSFLKGRTTAERGANTTVCRPPKPAVHPGHTCDWLLISSYPSSPVQARRRHRHAQPRCPAHAARRLVCGGQSMIPLARQAARMPRPPNGQAGSCGLRRWARATTTRGSSISSTSCSTARQRYVSKGRCMGMSHVRLFANSALLCLPRVQALRVLDSRRNPFPTTPPRAIRASLYHYNFTSLNRMFACIPMAHSPPPI